MLCFFSLGLIWGCAPLQPEAVIEKSAAELDRVDSIVSSVLENYLPPPAGWPPRVLTSSGETLPARLLQYLPISSLAYFPRLLPRLKASFQKGGFNDIDIQLSSAGEKNFCFLSVPISENISYRMELEEKVNGRIALIIDDVGFTLKHRRLLLDLDYPMTVAILPRLRYSSAWDELAASRGFEVILHCPLEPVNPEADPGPGKIMCETPADQVALIFEENLKDLPHAVGANNHMGSAFTTDTGAMRCLLEEIKKRDFFFVDSLTIPGTVTGLVAGETGLKFVRRDVFLDHERNEEFILSQLKVLKRKALRRGYAVGIGHYRQLTLEVLGRNLQALADDSLQIVPVSELVQ